MIGARAEAADDRGIRVRIERRTGDDLAEQLRVDAARAGECREQAPWPQQLQRQQVHVLVGARRALGMRGRRREFRRVEHDEVESGTAVAQLPQLGERVGLDPIRAIRGQRRIERQVLARQRQRVGRAVQRHHVRGAAGQRRQRESSGIGEHVERLAPGGERAHGGAVRPLVEVEPGLLARDDVDAVREARPRRSVTAAGSAPCTTPVRAGSPSSLRTSASERS